MQNIYQLIQSQEKQFNEQPVRVVDGYDFKQPDTLKRIYLYQNAQFYESAGKGTKDERVFFDISTPAVRNAAKNIDLDTKDIQFRAVNGDSNYFRSWLYRRKAQDWMRENGIARKLNSIPEKVSGVGTIVVKKVEGSRVFDFVNLRNLANDPTAKTLNDGWASERHWYLPDELRAQKERGWDSDKIEMAIKDFLTHRKENFVGDVDTQEVKPYEKAMYICVHEFYGYVPEHMLTDNEDDMELKLANFIVILPDDSKNSGDKRATNSRDGKAKEGLILYRKEIDEMPYKELHYRRVEGRWLGKGIYEECFPMQEVENTRNNWHLMAMNISRLILFQTSSKTVMQNVIKELQNGDILKFASKPNQPEPKLERVDTQIKDNASNNILAGTVDRTVRGLTNSFEVTTGATLPSGTPYSLGALMNQNANKLFDFIREDYGLFLEEIFNDWVLPRMEKELAEEGFLEIVDKDELEYIHEQYINWSVWDSIKKFLMLGKKPKREDIQLVEQFVRQQMEKSETFFLKYPKDFLSFEKRVTVRVTDESESPVLMQSLSNALQVVAQNPQILEMPAFQKILDMIGASKTDFIPKQVAGPVGPPQGPATPEVPVEPTAVPA